MTRYAYAERVVKKVRQILKYNPKVKDFINNHPSITLDDQYQLGTIVWNYYNYQLVVGSTSITFYNSFNRSDCNVIITYNSYDDLLKI